MIMFQKGKWTSIFGIPKKGMFKVHFFFPFFWVCVWEGEAINHGSRAMFKWAVFV